MSFHLREPTALVPLNTLQYWSINDWADAAAHSETLEWVNLSHWIDLNLRFIFLVVSVKSKSKFIIVIKHGSGHNSVFNRDVGIGYREIKHTSTVSPHINGIVQSVN